MGHREMREVHWVHESSLEGDLEAIPQPGSRLGLEGKRAGEPQGT